MTTSPELEGVLPVDKPVGPTSHDVVGRARRALRQRRIGHTGTLDPFASGLLLLCLGRATRIAEFLTPLPKTYHAVMRLGQATDTDDRLGAVVASSDGWQQLGRGDVAAALELQRGERLQVPPAYSAKKLAGERAYARARRGEEVAPAPAPVTIHEIRLLAWEPPLASFETTCSSGTYIRAIARDVGRELAAHAHLVELRRTAIGPWDVSRAVALDELTPEAAGDVLMPALDALGHLPRVDLTSEEAGHIRHGRAVPTDVADAAVVAIANAGELLAVGRIEGGLVRPRKVFGDG